LSGFIGVFHLDGRPADRAWIEGATETLTYRGPDAGAVTVAGGTALGHRLFRTAARQVAQPRTIDGTRWIVGDARIDARAELVARLRDAGSTGSTVDETVGEPTGDWNARTTPDVDLILAAYDAWGEDCVDRLIGDFSFAIWDAERRTLFAARDLFGVKLFYYAFDEGSSTLVFSNTLDAVRSHPSVGDRLNDVALMDFLVAGYNLDLATTTCADVARIPPGHAMTISAASPRPTVRRYRALPSPEMRRGRSERDTIEEFRAVFNDAVSDRLTTQSAGVFMSGGLDSTSIAAAAKGVFEGREGAYDLRACTLVIDDLIVDDERRFATYAARYIGIPQDCLPVDELAPFRGWNGGGFDRPEPYDEPLLACWVEEAKAVAKYARIGLYGEDPDTLLWPVPFAAELRQGPAATLGRAALYMFTNRKVPNLRTGLVARARGVRRTEATPAETLGFPDWLAPDFERAAGGRERFEYFWNEGWRNGTPPDSPHAEAHLALSAPIWQSFLESLDPGVTGIPLDARLPYLDERVVSFMLSLPTVPWRQRKYLLREAFADELPADVLGRPKTTPTGLFEARMLQFKRSSRSIEPFDRERLQLYVDLDALERRLEDDAPTAWTDLRPIALGHWLGGHPDSRRDGSETCPRRSRTPESPMSDRS
jgi:asparagine synthase (glutamine-hydrolysing)